MKLSPFGKLVRKGRIEAEITLGEMAKALNVSSAYLSAVETGKRPVSDGLVAEVKRLFKRKGLDVKDLDNAAAQSKKVIDVSDLSMEDRARVVAFARRLPRLKKSAHFKDIEEMLEV